MLLSKLIFTLVFVIGATSTSFAYDGEYYTYGNFDTVYEAFHTMALIFGDNAWMGLIFVAVTMGILFGITSSIAKSATGRRVSILGPTAVYILTGAVIYLALFSPASSGTLTIYDNNLNKQGHVKLPVGIVIIADTLSMIEDGIIRIIDTSRPVGAPSLRDSSMYVGFDTLKNLTSPRNLKDPYMYINIGNYITECVFFEMGRPGGSITVKDIESGTSKLSDVLAEAANPAIDVVIYKNPTDTTGEPMSCSVAWENHIRPYITNPQNFRSLVKTACANSGVDMNDPNQVVRCNEILNAVFRYSTTYSLSPEELAIETSIAHILAQKIEQGGNEGFYAQVTQRGVRDSIGALMGFDKYMPVLRGYLVAAVISISVLLLVFLPTPLFGKILSTILGLWLWLTIWAVCDAVVHRISLNTVYRSFEYIRENNLAMASLLSMPSYASNSLVMLGTFRGLGLMLATIVSGALVKFAGSHAMSSMVGKMSGQLQSVGQVAAPYGISGTPEQTDMLKKLNLDTIPTIHNANRFGFSTIRDVRTAEELGKTGASVEIMDKFGGSKALEGMYMHGNVARMINYGARGQAMSKVGLTEAFGRAIFDNMMKLTQTATVREAVRDHARKSGLSFNEAMKEWTEIQVAGNRAILNVFGDAGNYQKFLESRQEMSLGEVNALTEVAGKMGMSLADFSKHSKLIDLWQRAGILKAIANGELTYGQLEEVGAIGMISKAQGVEALKHVANNTLKPDGTPMSVVEFLKNREVMKNLRDSGAIEAFAGGRVTEQDLKSISYYNLLSEKGRKDAAMKLADFTGGRYEDYMEQLTTWQGMQNFIRFQELQNFANNNRIDLEELMRSGSRMTNIAVDEHTAKRLGLPGAGKYSVAWDEKGGFVFIEGEKGNKYWVGNSFIKEWANKTLISSGTSITGAPGVEDRDVPAMIDALQHSKGIENLVGRKGELGWVALAHRAVDIGEVVKSFLSQLEETKAGMRVGGKFLAGIAKLLSIDIGGKLEAGSSLTINDITGGYITMMEKVYKDNIGKSPTEIRQAMATAESDFWNGVKDLLDGGILDRTKIVLGRDIQNLNKPIIGSDKNQNQWPNPPTPFSGMP